MTGEIGAYFARSFERCVAAATARVISVCMPFGAISTSSAAAVVPPGEVTFWRSVAGRLVRAMQQLAGAGDGFARQFGREFRRQSGRDAGAGEFFGEQEHVGRSRAGHRGHRVHQAFLVDPFDRAGGAQQCVGDRALGGADVFRRRPRP